MSVRTSAPGASTTLTGRPAAVWSWRSCSGVGGPDIATARPSSARRIGSAPTARTIDSGSDLERFRLGRGVAEIDNRHVELFGEHLQQLAFVQHAELEQDLSEQLPGRRLLRQCVGRATSALMAPLSTSSSPSRRTAVAVGGRFWTIASSARPHRRRMARRDFPCSRVEGSPWQRRPCGRIHALPGGTSGWRHSPPPHQWPASCRPVPPRSARSARPSRRLTKPLLAGTEPGAGFAWLPTRRSDHFIRVDQGLPCTPLRASRPKATECDWT